MAVGPRPASGDRPAQPAARRLLGGLGRLFRALATLVLMAAVAFGAAYVAVPVELDRRGLTVGSPALAALEALRAPREAAVRPGAESAPAPDLARLERLLDAARRLLKAQGELMSARLELARLNAGRAAEEAELAADSLQRAAAALDALLGPREPR